MLTGMMVAALAAPMAKVEAAASAQARIVLFTGGVRGGGGCGRAVGSAVGDADRGGLELGGGEVGHHVFGDLHADAAVAVTLGGALGFGAGLRARLRDRHAVGGAKARVCSGGLAQLGLFGGRGRAQAASGGIDGDGDAGIGTGGGCVGGGRLGRVSSEAGGQAGQQQQGGAFHRSQSSESRHPGKPWREPPFPPNGAFVVNAKVCRPCRPGPARICAVSGYHSIVRCNKTGADGRAAAQTRGAPCTPSISTASSWRQIAACSSSRGTASPKRWSSASATSGRSWASRT